MVNLKTKRLSSEDPERRYAAKKRKHSSKSDIDFNLPMQTSSKSHDPANANPTAGVDTATASKSTSKTTPKIRDSLSTSLSSRLSKWKTPEVVGGEVYYVPQVTAVVFPPVPIGY